MKMNKSQRDGFRSEGAYRAVINSRGLKHYASPYYDPVKAHEYYEEHKHLKGRRAASNLNDEGKEIWKYTKDKITESKKAAIESEKVKKEQRLEFHRENVRQARERIADRLKQLQAHIKSLSTTGLSKEEKARVSAEKAKLRGEASTESEKVKSIRKEYSSYLKFVCQATREAYKQAKTDIDSSYEQIYQNEYDKILSEYEKPKKEKGSGSSSKKNIDERARKKYVERGLM